MAAWRVIFTDSESMTGVAPVCETDHSVHAEPGYPDALAEWVFDCCPYPHLELYSEGDALRVARELTMIDAKLCD